MRNTNNNDSIYKTSDGLSSLNMLENALKFKELLNVTVFPLSTNAKQPPKGFAIAHLLQGIDQSEKEAVALFQKYENFFPNQTCNWGYCSGKTKTIVVEDFDKIELEPNCKVGLLITTPSGNLHRISILDDGIVKTRLAKNRRTGQGYEQRACRGTYCLGVGSVIDGKYYLFLGHEPEILTVAEMDKRWELYCTKYDLGKSTASRMEQEETDKTPQDKADRIGRVVIKDLRGMKQLLESLGCNFKTDNTFFSKINRQGNKDEQASGSIYRDYKTSEARFSDRGNGGTQGDAYDLLYLISKYSFPEAEKYILQCVEAQYLTFPTNHPIVTEPNKKNLASLIGNYKTYKGKNTLSEVVTWLQKQGSNEVQVATRQIEKEIGISHVTIARAVATLTQNKFILLLQKARGRRPPVYDVVLLHETLTQPSNLNTKLLKLNAKPNCEAISNMKPDIPNTTTPTTHTLSTKVISGGVSPPTPQIKLNAKQIIGTEAQPLHKPANLTQEFDPCNFEHLKKPSEQRTKLEKAILWYDWAQRYRIRASFLSKKQLGIVEKFALREVGGLYEVLPERMSELKNALEGELHG